ncbi:uncharacterized protein [Clytia hemisphaerica]|uniref:Uncharacterized protein n=2 Tax=Clytia hemisphaerica TaxID=252671 RepID=A0A7M5WRP7_9CNID
MAFGNSSTLNMTTLNNTTENTVFECFKLPITVGNDTFCGNNLTRWESRYSEDGLKAMVIVPAIVALLVLIFRLWRSKFAVRENHEIMMEYERRLFKFRKNHKLERTDSMISREFEMYRVEFDIKDESENGDKDKIKLNCIVRCFQGIGRCFKVEDLGWKFISLKTFVTIKCLTYVKQALEVLDVILDCFLLYQLESGQIFDNVVHRNAYVTNVIYALIWLSIMVQFCSCDCCPVGQYDVFMKDMKSFITFLFIGSIQLILEYFYMDKFVNRKTDWYLFVKSAMQLVMTCWTIYSAIQNAKRARLVKIMDKDGNEDSGNVVNDIIEQRKQDGLEIDSELLAAQALQQMCKENIQKLDELENQHRRRANMKPLDPNQEKDGSVKMKFFSYMMIPIAMATMCRVIGSTYQYGTGKIDRSCFTVEDGGKIFQSPFDSGCMRGIDYLVVILTFTPLATIQIVYAVIHVWFRLNPRSSTLEKYFF